MVASAGADEEAIEVAALLRERAGSVVAGVLPGPLVALCGTAGFPAVEARLGWPVAASDTLVAVGLLVFGDLVVMEARLGRLLAAAGRRLDWTLTVGWDCARVQVSLLGRRGA